MSEPGTKTIFVDPEHGNDETGDGSMGKPFKHISAAQRDPKLGYWVFVKCGAGATKDNRVCRWDFEDYADRPGDMTTDE